MIDGIWESQYVQLLGIQDHCIEFLTLYNKLRVVKCLDKANETKVVVKVEEELMDLYLILEKRFKDSATLKEHRLRRFIEKKDGKVL